MTKHDPSTLVHRDFNAKRRDPSSTFIHPRSPQLRQGGWLLPSFTPILTTLFPLPPRSPRIRCQEDDPSLPSSIPVHPEFDAELTSTSDPLDFYVERLDNLSSTLVYPDLDPRRDEPSSNPVPIDSEKKGTTVLPARFRRSIHPIVTTLLSFVRRPSSPLSPRI